MPLETRVRGEHWRRAHAQSAAPATFRKISINSHVFHQSLPVCCILREIFTALPFLLKSHRDTEVLQHFAPCVLHQQRKHWREAQKQKPTFAQRGSSSSPAAEQLLVPDSSGFSRFWSHNPRVHHHLWADSSDAVPQQTASSLLCENSLSLTLFLHSEEQMRIGGDEGDKGWRDKAQRWK